MHEIPASGTKFLICAHNKHIMLSHHHFSLVMTSKPRLQHTDIICAMSGDILPEGRHLFSLTPYVVKNAIVMKQFISHFPEIKLDVWWILTSFQDTTQLHYWTIWSCCLSSHPSKCYDECCGLISHTPATSSVSTDLATTFSNCWILQLMWIIIGYSKLIKPWKWLSVWYHRIVSGNKPLLPSLTIKELLWH